MKRLIKYLAVTFTAALLCLTLFACGAEGTKYNYKEVKVECGDPQMLTAMSTYKTMFDTMYQDSYIEISDDEIKWTMKDGDGTMSYDKDGDKYIFRGDYVKTLTDGMKQGLGGIGGDITIALWGQDTEEGFEIVTEETISVSGINTSVTVKYIFTKA